MLNHIQVDAYGDKQPLPSVGQVVLKSEREITINVFDASIKDDVAKAIATAGMDMNPQIDGNVVRVPIPKTTKETRESLIKVASTQAEKTKQRMLKIRREGISKLKKMKTDKTIGEDEFFSLQQEVQEISDKYTKDVANLLNEKETSLRND
jgi:ribosome recycling factor